MSNSAPNVTGPATGSASDQADRSLSAPSLMVTGIALYLLLVALLSAYIMIAIFPRVIMKPLNPPEATVAKTGPEWEALVDLKFRPLRVFGHEVMGALEPAQGLLLLAFLGGLLGSFMHAAHSFAMYVGNRQLTRSWAWWYCLRPPIGGVLGLLFYFVVRAGLLTASVEAVSPYGVVAFGSLAGWFSKQATDKLAEMFESLFRTDKTKDYRDKLGAQTPTITKVTILPATQPSTDTILTVEGEHFQAGASVVLDRQPLKTDVVSPTLIKATVPAAERPAAGTESQLTVQNAGAGTSPSAPFAVRF